MKNASQKSILIVDDQPANLKVLFDLLEGAGFRVSVAKSGESAIAKAAAALPDLILLDIMMTGIDGYETCHHLKSQATTKNIPVIFLSAIDQPFNKVKAFSIGGSDYITKPFQTEEVLARVQHQLDLSEAKAEIVELNARLEERIKERTADLVTVNRSLAKEIEERESAEEALRHSALHDALTGLPNRVLFTEHLELAHKRAKRSADYQFAVLFIDLDGFKGINDTMGHQAGDDALVMVANRLQKMVRSSDILARLGGDEFTILLDQITDLENVLCLSKRILHAFEKPFFIQKTEVSMTASLGVAVNSPDLAKGSDLLRNADIAMYRAKQQGKSRIEVFDQEMYAHVLAKHQLERDLHTALNKREFTLYYQPIYHCQTAQIAGFEALIRWHHPERGWLQPREFMHLAEELGVTVEMGEWVIATACQQLYHWQAQFSLPTSMFVSVNVSAKQLRDANFLQTIRQVLTATGLDSRRLHLELTENMLMDDLVGLVDLLSKLDSQGIYLSIDDFGTGYSNLSNLYHLPLRTIKIDCSLIQPMSAQLNQRKVVEVIVHLAHQLGMTVTAEGIETEAQLNHLKNLGCERGQGYWFSKPLSGQATERLLAQNFAPQSGSFRASNSK